MMKMSRILDRRQGLSYFTTRAFSQERSLNFRATEAHGKIVIVFGPKLTCADFFEFTYQFFSHTLFISIFH